MRLAIVAGHAWGPAHDLRIPDQAAALARAGHEVRVFAPTAPRPPVTPDSVPVVTLPAGKSGRSRSASFGTALRKAWRDWQPDLVHAHHRLAGEAALTGVDECAAPVAFTFRQWEDGTHAEAPADGADRWQHQLAARVDRVIAETRAETDALVRLGVARQHMTLVPPGIDDALFSPDGERAASARTGPRLLTVAAVGAWDEPDRHGIVDAIRALGRAPAAELVVIGGPGPSGLADDPQVTKLRTVAERHGVAERVRFLGRLPREQLPAWYRSADLVVCPTHANSVGMSALEAMACGVPVVASATGGHRDTVVDGLTGVLVPPGHPPALAQAVRSVLGDQLRRMAYAAAARDRAQQCYSWQRVAGFLTGAYRQLCPTPDPEPLNTDADADAGVETGAGADAGVDTGGASAVTRTATV